jgi:ABC-type uncharacterized transport system substrate-binding protein
MPLGETKQRPVAGSMAQNGAHLVAFSQIVSRLPEALIQLYAVRVEHRVHIGALRIRTPFKEKVEKIPPPRLQGQVEARITARAPEEVLRRGVEVIVVSSTLTALAAKEATRTVPIVMTIPADPVAVGLVDSLARPGGNVTGLSFVGTEVAGKQVELLKEAVSGLASIAVLANPSNASHPPRTKQIFAISRTLGLRVEVVEASSRGGIGDAFGAMMKRGVGAAVVLADALFVREANAIIGLAAEQRLPAMYGLREAPLAGGLMSYGPSFTDLFRRAAGYVDKILRGARPSDLPIEQASRFELVINLKTAKALGLTIPPSLLARADQLIE